MKIIFIIFLIFFSNYILANEEDNNEVEVINLYENKSLDQMVLENLNDKKQIEEEVDNLNKANEIEIKDNDIEENETSKIDVNQIEIAEDNFIHKLNISDLNDYFNNLQKINSKTLQKEIVQVLENLQLNIENDQDNEIFFLIVNYLKSIGHINKSYELIERYDLTNDKNLLFYTEVKLNYLLSTFQLNEACNLNEELNANVKLNSFYLEKLDIFCLILNDNQSEARLLNSILIESEK